MEQLQKPPELTVIGHPVKMLVNFMELRVIPSEDGHKIIKLRTKEHQAINVYILYLQTIINKLQQIPNIYKLNKTIFIVEFLLVNKKIILIDNVSLCLIDIQIISLLKTLVHDLITNEKDLLNSWNCLIKTESTKLLFPARTDFVDSDCFGNSYKTIQKSWFSINQIKPQKSNLLKIFLPFCKYLLAGGMVKEVTQTPILRMQKIKLKLNSIQKKTFKMWSEHHRYSYNKAIHIINNEDNKDSILYKETKPENNNVYYSETDLRNLITPESMCSRTKWLLQTPKHIRESAVFEAHKNFKSVITNLKNGHIKYFNLKFKSKKNKSWAFEIPHTSINIYKKEIGIYEARTTNARIKTTEEIPTLEHNCNVMFNGLHYYLCVPKKIKLKTNENDGIYAALDPGVRKFQTIYSPDENNFIMIGKGASNVLYKHLLKLDKLIGSKNRIKILKLRLKIENLQSELHFKTSNYLCNNYKCMYQS